MNLKREPTTIRNGHGPGDKTWFGSVQVLWCSLDQIQNQIVDQTSSGYLVYGKIPPGVLETTNSQGSPADSLLYLTSRFGKDWI